jgi:hypothetical protein
MTFFVTSVGKGKGADLGGLDGADAHCTTLAKAAGSTLTSWRAYLSTQDAGGAKAVNARDRIGKGPWHNAKGEAIATSVDDLHSAASNKIGKQTALSEKGEPVNGRGDQPTGTTSSPDRTAKAGRFPPARIAPAATGPAAPRARPWSAITTAWV